MPDVPDIIRRSVAGARKLRTGLVYMAVLVLVVLSVEATIIADTEWDRIGSLSQVIESTLRFFAVDWSILPSLVKPAIETLMIACLGTLLGDIICIPAAWFGARLVIGLDAVPGRLEDVTLNVEKLDPKDLIGQVRGMCAPDGADVVIEVCGVPDVTPAGLEMLRTGGRYVLGGLVNPDADATVDANVLLRKWITLKGIHNYHPRRLIQALDFVMGNRHRFPFKDIVDSKFSLDGRDEAFLRASERSVLRAAIVP